MKSPKFFACVATAPLLALMALAFANPPVPASKADVAATATFTQSVQPLTTQYCVPCHGATRPPGGVDLTKYKSVADLVKDTETWRRVQARLRERTMPPMGSPTPTDAARKAAIDGLEVLLKAPADTTPNPGSVLIHRLNRAEYDNTIRDLTGVDSHPAANFPPDGSGGGGFDNDANTLFLPSMLMERYLQAATSVLQAANPAQIAPVRPTTAASAPNAARADITRFATCAYRRPVEATEVERLLGLYALAVRHGASFDAALRLPYKAILVSPDFLYRSEQDPVGASGPHALSDYALASRLSYFLWSSMPDETLMQLAAQNRLHDPAVLEAQTRRMLADPKSRALSENFVGQWLRTRELNVGVKPDPNRFPEYTPALRDALYQEPILDFDDVLHRNAGLPELIDADYTYVNEPLAKLYGIPDVSGPQMRRVLLPTTNRTRGGVVTCGAVLTLTSYPLRTSPVLRGKWVLEQMLGTAIPPPPPNVATLSPDDSPQQGLTFRQRLEQHRSKPECAGCHSKMDPMGFGLENFDAIGRWRTEIGGKPVDASGVLTTGEKFSGPAELKTLLLTQKEAFAHNLSEKMLSYALGRGLEPYDVAAVTKINAALKQDGYRADTLIEQVVQSYPFRYRQARRQSAEVVSKVKGVL